MIDGPTGQTVLVTGGAGFIGSHLVEALSSSNDVRVLDDLSSGSRGRLPDGVTLVEGDVRDADALDRATDGVDLIFHEAAVVDVGASVDDPVTTHDVNCTAALHLLERARREDARVVLASSAAIYGHPDRIPVDEDEPQTPTSPYGLQKLALDRYALIYRDLYDLETVPLRYFNVYGPRGVSGDYAGVIGVFLRQAVAGDPITVDGTGTQTRDFVHVDDVVRANLLAATTDHVGEAYNVGTGGAVSIRELADVVRDVTGSDSEVVHRDPRPGDIEHSLADVSKARDRLGYEPTVELADGLTDLAARLRTD